MSDTIALLEHLACAPYAAHEDIADLTVSLAPAVREALNSGDGGALAAALGLQPVTACMVFSPDQDQPKPDDGPAEDQPEPADIPDEPGA